MSLWPADQRRLVEALRFALDAHGAQTRKAKPHVPYASHLLQVAGLVLEHARGDVELAIAALLHDSVEDTEVEVEELARRFGARVARVVAACTDSLGPDDARDASDWWARKQKYLAAFPGKPRDARLVAACDKLHNLSNIVADLRVDASSLSRFNGGADGTLWYYRELGSRLGDDLPRPLCEDFRARLGELEALVSSGVDPIRAGGVLGIDVGYSRKRRSTGFCRLHWDDTRVDWRCALAGTAGAERRATLAELYPNSRSVLAVAIDGPLRPRFTVQAAHRACESAFSRGAFARRGKPGSTAGGSGPDLHRAATQLAALATDALDVGETSLECRLHEKGVFEAFPNLFLGVLCDEERYPERPIRNRQWTDTLFPLVSARLRALLGDLLPGRHIAGEMPTGHDEIGAFACALTALCAALGRFVAVGSSADGWMLLPPESHWGRAADDDGRWADRELAATLADARADFPGLRRWSPALSSGSRSRA